MKTFNAPTIEIEKLNIVDVITTSCAADCPEYEDCATFVCPLD